MIRVLLDIFRYFSGLLSSIFSIFWNYNKCDFYVSPCKMWNCVIFSSNCSLLSAIFSTIFTQIVSYDRPSVILFFFMFNQRYFWILSMSSCSVHFAHQIDLKKRYREAFFVKKNDFLLLKFKKLKTLQKCITLSKCFFAAALVNKHLSGGFGFSIVLGFWIYLSWAK